MQLKRLSPLLYLSLAHALLLEDPVCPARTCHDDPVDYSSECTLECPDEEECQVVSIGPCRCPKPTCVRKSRFGQGPICSSVCAQPMFSYDCNVPCLMGEVCLIAEIGPCRCPKPTCTPEEEHSSED
ncbi:MAG: hypothetical protein DHS80DRAFT_32270 [Piptocephalis tieghemiana]|nr:MAG: hypothetical protein DHS80DRAFT_32270 [Piptocephalis tieghemiana]